MLDDTLAMQPAVGVNDKGRIRRPVDNSPSGKVLILVMGNRHGQAMVHNARGSVRLQSFPKFEMAAGVCQAIAVRLRCL